ncbi:hypothetical protein MBANPS3_000589 [Mucor bainieri]
MKNFTDSWLESKGSLSTDALEEYHLISISRDCSCAVKTSRRMLLETGLKPAISGIAKIIIGTTFSTEHFGLYQLSALFVKEDVDLISNGYCLHFLEHYLKEQLRNSVQQTDPQRPTLLIVNKKIEQTVEQYLVRGIYTQVASTSYSIHCSIEAEKSHYSWGVLDNDLNAYIDLPGTYSNPWTPSKFGATMYKFTADKYAILNKGEELPNTGLKKTILFSKHTDTTVDFDIKRSTQSGANQIIVDKHSPTTTNGECFYMTIDILPLHYLSKIRIFARNIWTSQPGLTLESSKLTEIQERLCLTKD